MVRLTDRPDMTVAADVDVNQQTIKLLVRIQLVSYHPFISNEMELNQSTVGRYLSCLFIEHYVSKQSRP